MDEQVVNFAIRFASVIIWMIIGLRIRRRTEPVSPFTRRMIIGLFVLGLWLLPAGSLSALGLIPTEIIRYVITGYTAICGVVGIALLWSRQDI